MLEKISPTLKQGSVKSFGISFSIVFLIIGLYPLINSQEHHLWAIVVSVIFLLLAFLLPKALSLPNRLWFKFGIVIGSLMTPIIISLIYLIIVLPTGLIFRLLGKDLLHKKLDKNVKSYWIKRSKNVGSMKNQF